MQWCVGVRDCLGRVKQARVAECIVNVQPILVTNNLGNTSNKNAEESQNA
jgi:hypothetical protein